MGRKTCWTESRRNMSMKEFEVGSWTLCRTGADEEPKIADDELARVLGYEGNPVEIKKRIKRYLAQEILNDVEVIATVAKTGRPGQRFLLNEHQALFVAARCETPLANEILKEMIHVFTLARKGMLPGQGTQSQQIDVASLGASIAKAVAEGVTASNALLLEHVNRSNVSLVEGMGKMLSSFEQTMQQLIDKNLQSHVEGAHSTKLVIGAGGAWQIRERLKVIAEIYAPKDASKQKKLLSGLHLNLRARLGFYGTRKNWCYLPQDKWHSALGLIEEAYRQAERVAHQTGAEIPKPPSIQMCFGWGDPSKTKKGK